ncbi:MAG: hypothetical protein AAGA60_06355 [Cyanobacteria bacterium P01_E01_bin.42]
MSSVACESIALPPSKEPLKCIIVGSRQGVTSTIQRLHQLGFAEIGNWSPLQPTQNPAEFMSVLIRYIPRS